MKRPAREHERQRESRAILDRIRQETEPQVGAHTPALFLRLRDHMAARDADPADRLEVVGTRIGRALGLLGFFVLAALLAIQVGVS